MKQRTYSLKGKDYTIKAFEFAFDKRKFRIIPKTGYGKCNVVDDEINYKAMYCMHEFEIRWLGFGFVARYNRFYD